MEEDVLAQGREEDQEDQDEFFDQADIKVFSSQFEEGFDIFFLRIYVPSFVIIVLVSVMT